MLDDSLSSVKLRARVFGDQGFEFFEVAGGDRSHCGMKFCVHATGTIIFTI